jgi:hypothetical protein
MSLEIISCLSWCPSDPSSVNSFSENAQIYGTIKMLPENCRFRSILMVLTWIALDDGEIALFVWVPSDSVGLNCDLYNGSHFTTLNFNDKFPKKILSTLVQSITKASKIILLFPPKNNVELRILNLQLIGFCRRAACGNQWHKFRSAMLFPFPTTRLYLGRVREHQCNKSLR